MKKMKNMMNNTKKFVAVALITATALMSNTATAYAATPTPAPSGGGTSGSGSTGVASVDFGIGKLIGLLTGLVSAYGIVLLIKNGVEFFSALSDRDSATMKQAGLGMLSGFGIASIGAVITYLGFTV